MSEMKPIWHTANDLPKEGDFIALLTPSLNLVSGRFEYKTKEGIFALKSRSCGFSTMDVAEKWAYVDDLIAIDILHDQIMKLEEALKKICKYMDALKGDEND